MVIQRFLSNSRLGIWAGVWQSDSVFLWERCWPPFGGRCHSSSHFHPLVFNVHWCLFSKLVITMLVVKWLTFNSISTSFSMAFYHTEELSLLPSYFVLIFYQCDLDSYFIQWVIIYFDAHIVPGLACENPFMLASLFFWHVLVILCAVPNLLAQGNVHRSSNSSLPQPWNGLTL